MLLSKAIRINLMSMMRIASLHSILRDGQSENLRKYIMQKINFDKPVNRENTLSTKFDSRQQYFGTQDINPLWVADMDFEVPACVSDALKRQVDHAVFGYSFYPETLYQSIIDWFSRQHQWTIQRDWILMVPGVVPSLYASVLATTQENDGVIVQSPVYFPFFSAVTANQRRLLNNELINSQGYYQINFDDLENCARQGAKLLMLCTPHNPVGRVWTESELHRILDISRQYDLTIISDDIHCDLIYSGHQHTILQTLAKPDDKIITAIAPSKTFNIPGLGLSALIIPDKNIRQAVKKEFDKLYVSNQNPLSIIAFEAAYTGGDEWLRQLLIYLQETLDFVIDYFQRHIPKIKVTKPEATYLIWLDCRDLQLNDTELRRFFIEECKLGLNPGLMFGDGGSGFMRLNIGTRKALIEQAVENIKNSLATRL
jgi:cysteine-S-conjugate beta-lyase